MRSIRILYNFRGFIYTSVKQEFQRKYRNSILGFLWALINPLFLIIIYTVVFSQVLSPKLSETGNSFTYGIYLCSGLLTWNYFTEVTVRGLNLFIDNANLLKKINFPKLSLLIVSFIGASINFLIIFFLFAVFLLITNSLHWAVLVGIIPVLLIQIVFALSMGFILGVINVFFRDVGHFFSMFLQFWFWCTPIVYPINVLPGSIKNLIEFNPMYAIINAYQNILVFGKNPEWSALLYPVVLSLLMCIAAYFLYKNVFNQMVDEL